MNPIHTIRRLACTLAGLATAGLAFTAAAPAAQASDSPPAAGAGAPAYRVVPASSAMSGGRG
jgi:hypothetical protein